MRFVGDLMNLNLSSNTVGVLVLIGLLVVGWRFLRPKRRAAFNDRPRRPERKVEGFQLWSPLHVAMGRGCITDHGMQYGPGFRRKESPLLPHDPNCQCETVPFTFTGSEVFTGALRRIAEPKSQVPGIPDAAVPKLMTELKRVNAEVVPPETEAYVALFNLGGLDPEVQPAAIAFLRERHGVLTRASGQAERPAESSPAPTPTTSSIDPAGGTLNAPAPKST
jgi:hypothetical protein